MSRRRMARAAAAAGGAVLLFTLLTAGKLFGSDVALVVSDLGLVVGAVAAATACFVASFRSEQRSRTAWRLMGAALASWAIGEGTWSAYELGAGGEVPFPSFADAGYLGAIPLAAFAMLRFPQAPRRNRTRVRLLLDAVSLAASLLLISWVTVLRPLAGSISGEPLEAAIALAYPLGDVVLVTIIVSVLANTTAAGRTGVLLLGGGLLALSLADSAYTYYAIDESFLSAGIIDAGWLAGYLLIALAALAPRNAAGARDRGFTIVGIAVPYAFVVSAIALATYQKVVDGRMENVIFWLTLAIVLVVLARQFLTRLENVSLSRHLESRVRERTAELEAALRRVEESRALQDAFIAAVSHELRTPLTTIIGVTQTLERGGAQIADPMRSDLAASATRAAHRMARQVEDLLLASGIETDIPSNGSPLDVTAEVRGVLESVNARPIRAGRLDPAVAVGDARSLRMILGQIFSNAVKFSPDGSPIEVGVRSGGNGIEVSVSDRGVGIPEGDRDRVFDRFYQIDSSPTRRFGGVGLGLYIARRLADAMDATLDVGDGPGGGTTVRLTLKPLERLDRSVAPVPTAASA